MSTFQIDRTFTWLDWTYAEQIEKKSQFNEFLTSEQLRLIFSVFPEGQTLLTLLSTISMDENLTSLEENNNKMESY